MNWKLIALICIAEVASFLLGREFGKPRYYSDESAKWIGGLGAHLFCKNDDGVYDRCRLSDVQPGNWALDLEPLATPRESTVLPKCDPSLQAAVIKMRQ